MMVLVGSDAEDRRRRQRKGGLLTDSSQVDGEGGFRRRVRIGGGLKMFDGEGSVIGSGGGTWFPAVRAESSLEETGSD